LDFGLHRRNPRETLRRQNPVDRLSQLSALGGDSRSPKLAENSVGYVLRLVGKFAQSFAVEGLGAWQVACGGKYVTQGAGGIRA